MIAIVLSCRCLHDLGSAACAAPLTAAAAEAAREERAAAVEKRWIEEMFQPAYLYRPIGHRPCSTAAIPDARNLLAALDHGLFQVSRAEAFAGEKSLDAYLLSSEANVLTDQLVRVEASATSAGPSSAALAGLLHLLYDDATLRLAQGGSPQVAAERLRVAISCARLLARQKVINPFGEDPTGQSIPLPTPACTSDAAPLSVYDLYNNLVVAEQLLPGSSAGAAMPRRAESDPVVRFLWRTAGDPKLNGAVSGTALATAADLLRWAGQITPALAFNLAQLLERVLPWAVEESIRLSLREERDRLLDIAAGDDQLSTTPGLRRLELLRAVDEASEWDLPERSAAHLSSAQRQVVSAVRFTSHLRTRRTLIAGEHARLVELLGPLAGEWLRAADVQVAGAAVPPAISARPRSPGPALPGLVTAGGRGIGFQALTAACIAAALVLALWLRLELRRRKALFTSYYQRDSRRES